MESFKSSCKWCTQAVIASFELSCEVGLAMYRHSRKLARRLKSPTCVSSNETGGLEVDAGMDYKTTEEEEMMKCCST